MLLNEFFGHSINLKTSDKKDDKNQSDELFWYFIDHDKLHKDYVMPIAQKIKHSHKKGTVDVKALVDSFMPMVEKGCMEFYHKKKLEGSPGKVFPKEMREELCQRLYDHYCDDVLKDEYKLG
jgi:hypothetical protein